MIKKNKYKDKTEIITSVLMCYVKNCAIQYFQIINYNMVLLHNNAH